MNFFLHFLLALFLQGLLGPSLIRLRRRIDWSSPSLKGTKYWRPEAYFVLVTSAGCGALAPLQLSGHKEMKKDAYFVGIVLEVILVSVLILLFQLKDKERIQSMEREKHKELQRQELEEMRLIFQKELSMEETI